MAISRHSDEWKRTIATAALLGVTFIQVRSDWRTGRATLWLATFDPATTSRGGAEGTSKIEAARAALRLLGAEISKLPDAAEKRAARNAASELRSSP